MKLIKCVRISVVTALALFCLSCSSKETTEVTVDDIRNPATPEGVSEEQKADMPVISFTTLHHDFGKVIKGEQLSYAFKFTNTGKSNLIISNTRASCGCTTSIPPKEPIKPGDSGEIVVKFDSKRKHGKVKQTVVVGANTYPVQTVLTITAEVVKP